MEKLAKQDDWARITLRLPQWLHDDLVEAAKNESLNAHIVQRLQDSLEGRTDWKAAAETALRSLEGAAADTRELTQELRVVVSQLKLMRHILDRVIAAKGKLPPDLKVLVDLLGVRDIADIDGTLHMTAKLLKEALDATEKKEQAER